MMNRSRDSSRSKERSDNNMTGRTATKDRENSKTEVPNTEHLNLLTK